MAIGLREPISKSLRFDILHRDEFACQLCGATAKSGAKLEIDHRVPVARGGKNTRANLWTLCVECNRGKRDKILEDDVLNIHVACERCVFPINKGGCVTSVGATLKVECYGHDSLYAIMSVAAKHHPRQFEKINTIRRDANQATVYIWDTEDNAPIYGHMLMTLAGLWGASSGVGIGPQPLLKAEYVEWDYDAFEASLWQSRWLLADGHCWELLDSRKLEH